MTTDVHPLIKGAAYAVPLCVLPSSVWRLGFPKDPSRKWEYAYVPGLSAVSMGAAALTIGLVRPWGEKVPRWVPGIGGKKVPVAAAVVPATAGAVAVMGMMAHATRNGFFGGRKRQQRREQLALPPLPTGRKGAVMRGAYAPLVAWGPLVLVVTADYYRRRTRRPDATKRISS
ncbi:hypothetical protein JIG36_28600 [Actinoplanes sp. LDG1-06]|uniref:Integral membrane protein n=1 Tax=Paractinoplanes ovalisporus TaxID=2810368 RepID=A0ABS2AJV1_9ACTN|nr:hypothetical protein [Actinoplanes ovalisporus]MBM2619521.1 hypothetical protein [Actinoplanes ovalisporus]